MLQIQGCWQIRAGYQTLVPWVFKTSASANLLAEGKLHVLLHYGGQGLLSLLRLNEDGTTTDCWHFGEPVQELDASWRTLIPIPIFAVAGRPFALLAIRPKQRAGVSTEGGPGEQPSAPEGANTLLDPLLGPAAAELRLLRITENNILSLEDYPIDTPPQDSDDPWRPDWTHWFQYPRYNSDGILNGMMLLLYNATHGITEARYLLDVERGDGFTFKMWRRIDLDYLSGYGLPKDLTTVARLLWTGVAYYKDGKVYYAAVEKPIGPFQSVDVTPGNWQLINVQFPGGPNQGRLLLHEKETGRALLKDFTFPSPGIGQAKVEAISEDYWARGHDVVQVGGSLIGHRVSDGHITVARVV